VSEQAKPLTMSAEREACLREYSMCIGPVGPTHLSDALCELDATRARLAKVEAERDEAHQTVAAITAMFGHPVVHGTPSLSEQLKLIEIAAAAWKYVHASKATAISEQFDKAAAAYDAQSAEYLQRAKTAERALVVAREDADAAHNDRDAALADVARLRFLAALAQNDYSMMKVHPGSAPTYDRITDVLATIELALASTVPTSDPEVTDGGRVLYDPVAVFKAAPKPNLRVPTSEKGGAK
jgi:hypothetical protein